MLNHPLLRVVRALQTVGSDSIVAHKIQLEGHDKHFLKNEIKEKRREILKYQCLSQAVRKCCFGKLLL